MLQDALSEELLASYEQTVLTAVEEVENAMAAYVQEVQRREALQRSVVAARASVEAGRYPVSQRPHRLPERPGYPARAVPAGGRAGPEQGAVTQFLIQLYEALGGGWGPATEEAPPATSRAPEPAPLPAPPRPTV